MACYHPLWGYRVHVPDGRGGFKPSVTLSRGSASIPVLRVPLPCGGCVGCRLERARQWAVRCMHEASLYEENCFITLTYDEAHLPENASLKKRDFQLFMKRLRKRFPQKIRFFHSGEYGARSDRPHYHALLFGFDFPDKEYWSERHGQRVWRSKALEELWPSGNSEVGSVSFEAASYVARYVLKKLDQPSEDPWCLVDEDTGEFVERAPEYSTMSRRPGIGRPWLDRYMCDVYPADGVVVRGHLQKPPRYYDLQYEIVDPRASLEVSRKRRRGARAQDATTERLADREVCTQARLARYERSL